MRGVEHRSVRAASPGAGCSRRVRLGRQPGRTIHHQPQRHPRRAPGGPAHRIRRTPRHSRIYENDHEGLDWFGRVGLPPGLATPSRLLATTFGRAPRSAAMCILASVVLVAVRDRWERRSWGQLAAASIVVSRPVLRTSPRPHHAAHSSIALASRSWSIWSGSATHAWAIPATAACAVAGCGVPAEGLGRDRDAAAEAAGPPGSMWNLRQHGPAGLVQPAGGPPIHVRQHALTRQHRHPP